MAFELAPGIACCDVDGSVIGLDVNRDRYFALAPSSGAALRALTRGVALDADGHRAIEGLLARGILRGTALRNDRPILTPPLPIAASVLDADAEPRRTALASGMVRASYSLALATLRMKSSRFASNLAFAIAGPAKQDVAVRGSAVATDAILFEAARRYLPVGRSCLRDSLALLHFLRAHADRPTIVFGVRTDPFRAHCWIQLGGTLLNETVDLARLFTPILVG